ncbi:Ig-like domain-containing protein [Halosimplex pelagicum]|uniref:Ig-like domain-containing protein n=1 Tax=Halosimplex pelagicum TaxID=869886 RepID=A0A7D5PA65_9EURY|nr:Ig-like domain-containing protein [Halosimplex pelagicum]QLH84503.1 Ig-like domain-containing protein [Halosimplex pelagicum]
MEPWDDRGQSIQIGAVLIFAALILLLSLYQATIVPQQNERVEFDHSQQVQSDLLDLRNAVTSTFGESASRSVSIQLGTTYPSRVLAVNPPPVSGLVRTAGTADGDVSFELDNAVALDDETDDFWDGSVDSGGRYQTGSIVYRPSYNEYGQPPRTVYDSTVLYDNFTFEGATIARSGQTLIDGSTISLVALNGSLQQSSSGAASVDVRPKSASSTTVAVRNSAAGNITIRTATRLPNSTWTELLADESNVTGWETSALIDVDEFRMLEVELKPGTYELRMAKAGVGTRVTDTSAAYMTDVAADGSTVPENGSVRLTVEVRDAYNNPVADVNVTGSTGTSVGDLAEAEVATGDDGRASFVYEAPESVNAATEVPVEFTFDPTTPPSFDPDAPEDVEAVVEVQNTQVDGASGGGSAPFSVTWDSPEVSETGTYLSSCDSSDCTWDVGADTDDTLDLSAVVEDIAGGVDNTTVDGTTVDFALNNGTVGTLSSESDVSDNSGTVETTLTASENGTVRLYAVSGGASDPLNVTVTNVTGASSQGPTLGFRVDDFSDRRNNDPNFVASYDVSDTSSSYERVEVSFAASDGNPSGTRQSDATRGSFSYQPGFGDGEQFDVTLDVIYTDDQGNEYVAASKTITDTADARNPTSQNADLSESNSASLDSVTIEDRSKVKNNDVRYRFSYTVSGSGTFSQVRLFALNLNGNGATGFRDETSRSGKNVDLKPGDGTNTQYRLGVAVYDADGAIVEMVDRTDAADGDGVVLTATVALLAVALAGHAIRRSSIH